MQKLILLVCIAAICITATAQTPAVLKSETLYRPVGGTIEVEDSVQFIHLNGKNSIPSWRPYQYTSDRTYFYDTAYLYRLQSGQLAHVWKLVETFNSNNFVAMREEHQYDKNAKTYKLVNRYRYTYNSALLLDTFHAEIYSNVTNAWAPNQRTTYVYDANKRLIEQQFHLWKGVTSTWAPDNLDSFWYNGNGNLVATKTKMWHWSTGILDDSTYHHFTYNSNDLLVADTTFDKDAINRKVKGYVYDANNRLIKDSSYNWVNPSLGWHYNGKSEYIYDVNGNLVQVNGFTWDKTNSVYVHKGKEFNDYNQTHQLTKQYSEQWNNGAWINNGGYRSLLYDVPNGIYDAKTTPTNFSIYPIPATAYINLDITLEEPAEISGVIFDMQGRVVKQFSEKAATQLHKTVFIYDLSAGQYTMSVRAGARFSAAQRFTVVK